MASPSVRRSVCLSVTLRVLGAAGLRRLVVEGGQGVSGGAGSSQSRASRSRRCRCSRGRDGRRLRRRGGASGQPTAKGVARGRRCQDQRRRRRRAVLRRTFNALNRDFSSKNIPERKEKQSSIATFACLILRHSLPRLPTIKCVEIREVDLSLRQPRSHDPPELQSGASSIVHAQQLHPIRVERLG